MKIKLTEQQKLARARNRKEFNKPPRGHYLLRVGTKLHSTDKIHLKGQWTSHCCDYVHCAWFIRRKKKK